MYIIIFTQFGKQVNPKQCNKVFFSDNCIIYIVCTMNIKVTGEITKLKMHT